MGRTCIKIQGNYRTALGQQRTCICSKWAQKPIRDLIRE